MPVYDFGEQEVQPFLVQRYMSGGTLLDRMERGPLPLEQIVEIRRRIGSALDYAHSNGIVHRDLKPANILFGHHGNPYLTDFGIVRLAESTATYTGTGIIGTPAYMSPEQVHGDKTIDGRSDIYSLGVITFEMLTGQTPFHADTPAKLMMAHVLKPVPKVNQFRRNVPPDCQNIVDRAMAKDRDARFSTAEELAITLGGVGRQPAQQAQPAPQPLDQTVLEPFPLPGSHSGGQARIQTSAPTAAEPAVEPGFRPVQPAAPVEQPLQKRSFPMRKLIGMKLSYQILDIPSGRG